MLPSAVYVKGLQHLSKYFPFYIFLADKKRNIFPYKLAFYFISLEVFPFVHF